MPDPTSPVSQADIDRTMAAARAARENAYAPYSNFKVGAAVLTHDGQIFPGCNVEVASWEEATCAERTAIANAVTAGAANVRPDFIKLVAVCVQGAAHKQPLTLISPCGACRQVISDFCNPPQCTLVMDDTGKGHSFTMDALLPHGFRFARHIEKTASVSCEALQQQALHNPHTGNLLEIARAMRSNAARHVQDLPEGAIILTTDGRAFCGASVENGCTALNMRTLRIAVDRAVVEGAASSGQAFVKRAVIAIPGRGRTRAQSLRQAVNPALLAEFFTDDAEITVQISDAPAFSFRAGDAFAWIEKLA